MRRIDSVPRTTRTLLTIAALLAAVILLEWSYPAAPRVEAPDPGEFVEGDVPDFSDTDFSPPLIGELSHMFERPLFIAGRRMPELPAEPVEPPKPLQLKLEGVAITTEQRVAVLRDRGNNRLVQLAEGMSHDGWTLDSVNSNLATFRRGPEVQELPLDPGTSGRRR